MLGHFIGDNPLQSQGGSEGIQGAIRSSVSSLLSDQLNKLAGNLIGGIQLSFDLTSGEDYSTGVAQNRTDLKMRFDYNITNNTKMYLRLARESETADYPYGLWWGPSSYELPSHVIGKNLGRSAAVNVTNGSITS